MEADAANILDEETEAAGTITIIKEQNISQSTHEETMLNTSYVKFQ